MTKYALLTSSLVRTGCLTNPAKPTTAPPAAITTPATTAGEITTIESPAAAKRITLAQVNALEMKTYGASSEQRQ